jgi:hypothetical protein
VLDRLFALKVFLAIPAISAEGHGSEARNLDVASATHATSECAFTNSLRSRFNVPQSLALASALLEGQLAGKIGGRALTHVATGSLAQRSPLLFSAPQRLERFGAHALQHFLKCFKFFGVHGSILRSFLITNFAYCIPAQLRSRMLVISRLNHNRASA